MSERYIPPEGGLGSPGPPAEGYPEEPRTDQDVIEGVRAAFHLDPDFTTEQFEIDCREGVVTLKGYVRSQEERRRAVDLVGDVDGVRRVVDELVVRG